MAFFRNLMVNIGKHQRIYPLNLCLPIKLICTHQKNSYELGIWHLAANSWYPYPKFHGLSLHIWGFHLPIEVAENEWAIPHLSDTPIRKYLPSGYLT
jgi:hypothetical protein